MTGRAPRNSCTSSRRAPTRERSRYPANHRCSPVRGALAPRRTRAQRARPPGLRARSRNGSGGVCRTATATPSAWTTPLRPRWRRRVGLATRQSLEGGSSSSWAGSGCARRWSASSTLFGGALRRSWRGAGNRAKRGRQPNRRAGGPGHPRPKTPGDSSSDDLPLERPGRVPPPQSIGRPTLHALMVPHRCDTLELEELELPAGGRPATVCARSDVSDPTDQPQSQVRAGAPCEFGARARAQLKRLRAASLVIPRHHPMWTHEAPACRAAATA